MMLSPKRSFWRCSAVAQTAVLETAPEAPDWLPSDGICGEQNLDERVPGFSRG